MPPKSISIMGQTGWNSAYTRQDEGGGGFNGLTQNIMVQAYYKSPNNDFILAHGDCFKLLKEFDFKFDMIFADPPYFLSNGGISLQSGKVVWIKVSGIKVSRKMT